MSASDRELTDLLRVKHELERKLDEIKIEIRKKVYEKSKSKH